MEISFPPWAAPARERKPPKTPLTLDAIVDAAFAVLDREGYERLSMRQVAAELGTGVSSLYTHVSNKEELLYWMWERTFDRPPVPEPTTDPELWRGRLADYGRAYRSELRKHRDMARISMGQAPIGPQFLDHLERVAAFLGALLPPAVAGAVAPAISNFVEGYVFEEQIWDGRLQQLTDEQREQVEAGLRDFFAGISPERYPNLAAQMPHMAPTDPETRFDAALDVFVRGLMTYIEDPRRPA